MHHHPIISYLRLVGFTIGALLFVVMVYRSSQMVNNPIYVKGKPFLEQLASTSKGYPTLTGVSFGPVAQQAHETNQGVPATTTVSDAAISDTTPAPVVSSRTDMARYVQATTQPATQTAATNHGGNVPQGKALGVVKLSN